MTDIGQFTEPKNKMVPLLPWEPCPSEFEVQKNNSFALIIEILYLKQIFFETDNCLLVLTTSTSHKQRCFKIDLGLIKLSNVKFLCLKVRAFLSYYHEMVHMWVRIQAFDQVFKIPTAQTCSEYYARD